MDIFNYKDIELEYLCIMEEIESIMVTRDRFSISSPIAVRDLALRVTDTCQEWQMGFSKQRQLRLVQWPLRTKFRRMKSLVTNRLGCPICTCYALLNLIYVSPQTVTLSKNEVAVSNNATM